MSQIATEKEHGVGRNTAIYEISDIDIGIYRVETPSGIGVIPLCEINNDNATSDRINTQYGIKAIWAVKNWPVIQSMPSPESYPSGIGGDSKTIWLCHWSGGIYEISTSDLGVIRSEENPESSSTSIGGDTNTIWSAYWYSGNGQWTIYELATSDFSIVRETTKDFELYGIGGNSNVIWVCDGGGKVYELDPLDFSVIRMSELGSSDATGIGGDDTTIWMCFSEDICELDHTDFSFIRTANSPGGELCGIGGNNKHIWHCDYYDGKLFELNVNWLEECI